MPKKINYQSTTIILLIITTRTMIITDKYVATNYDLSVIDHYRHNYQRMHMLNLPMDKICQ